MNLLRDAADEVLSSGQPHATRGWHNDATGNGGEIRVVARFDTDDRRECRRLRVDIHTLRAGDRRSMMNVCRSAGGRWLMDPDARPAVTGTR